VRLTNTIRITTLFDGFGKYLGIHRLLYKQSFGTSNIWGLRNAARNLGEDEISIAIFLEFRGIIRRMG
jgi:hypothetical protein